MKYLIGFVFIILFISCSKEKRSDKAGEEMQDFVIEIADYAKGYNPNFIVVPQNGPELAFNNLDINDGIHSGYNSAVKGFGIEELFYNGSYSLDNERLTMLRKLKAKKKILVADYLSTNADTSDAIQKNLDEGFICFPRHSGNYDYKQIPAYIINENNNDINTLADAQNYLYLISSEDYSSKDKFIDAIAETNYDLVIIDLFYGDKQFTSIDIKKIKTKQNGGKRLVISYMNIGAAEKYRYYWEDDWKLHKPRWLKKPYEGYEDEIWVKFWKKDWKAIIYGNDNSYTKKILNAGFDGAYLDNVEAYYFLYFD